MEACPFEKAIFCLLGLTYVGFGLSIYVKRIEVRTMVRTRLVVFTNRQCERDNGRLSINSRAVIQIIRQEGVLLSKQ